MKGHRAQILKGGKVYIDSKKEDNLYLVKSKRLNRQFCRKSSDSISELELWHKRFGHLNLGDLSFLQSKQMVHGLPKFNQQKLDCTVCIKAKQTREPFPKKNQKRQNRKRYGGPSCFRVCRVLYRKVQRSCAVTYSQDR